MTFLADIEAAAFTAAHVADELRGGRSAVHGESALVVEMEKGLDIEGFAGQVIDGDVEAGNAPADGFKVGSDAGPVRDVLTALPGQRNAHTAVIADADAAGHGACFIDHDSAVRVEIERPISEGANGNAGPSLKQGAEDFGGRALA